MGFRRVKKDFKMISLAFAWVVVTAIKHCREGSINLGLFCVTGFCDVAMVLGIIGILKGG